MGCANGNTIAQPITRNSRLPIGTRRLDGLALFVSNTGGNAPPVEFRALQAVAFENLSQFRFFLVRKLLDFKILPALFRGEMLLIGSRGQIPAQSHCGRSGDDFGQSGRDNDVGGRHGG